MKNVLAIAFCLLGLCIQAQTTTTNIIEVGKTLVELISVFKKSKPATAGSITDRKISTDSCAIKQQ